jgi:hypothetical protein
MIIVKNTVTVHPGVFHRLPESCADFDFPRVDKCRPEDTDRDTGRLWSRFRIRPFARHSRQNCNRGQALVNYSIAVVLLVTDFFRMPVSWLGNHRSG